MRAFKSGYTHYGTKEAIINGRQYVHVDKEEGPSEPLSAFTFLAGGVLEVGKKEAEMALQKREPSAESSVPRARFDRALPLIKLGADEFGFFWGPRDREDSAARRTGCRG